MKTLVMSGRLRFGRHAEAAGQPTSCARWLKDEELFYFVNGQPAQQAEYERADAALRCQKETHR